MYQINVPGMIALPQMYQMIPLKDDIIDWLQDESITPDVSDDTIEGW